METLEHAAAKVFRFELLISNFVDRMGTKGKCSEEELITKSFEKRILGQNKTCIIQGM